MNEIKCTCAEPHISKMVIHRYDGKPCYLKPIEESSHKEEDWRERFDDFRNELHHCEPREGERDGTVCYFGYKTQRGNELFEVTDWGHIKSFIESLLTRQKEGLRIVIESKRKEKIPVPAPCPDDTRGCLVNHSEYKETPEIRAYNQALEDALADIEKMS